MEITYYVADPAGNMTGLVQTVLPRSMYRDISTFLLENNDHQLEQIGFMEECADCAGHLEMMGGEFCGNAARSFGLFTVSRTDSGAEKNGAKKVGIRISGAADVLEVMADPTEQTAQIQMPAIQSMDLVETSSYGRIPLVMMEGISHALVIDKAIDKPAAEALIRELAQHCDSDAIGIMYYDSAENFMTPLVWVKSTDTYIWESSCGSGSCALASWLKQADPGEWRIQFNEPGGILAVSGTADNKLFLGGPVKLTGPFRAELPKEFEV